MHCGEILLVSNFYRSPIITSTSDKNNANLIRVLLSSNHDTVMHILLETSVIGMQPTISFIVCWDFSMFYQIFLSPEVKRGAIITYKHDISELPHELLNDLRLALFYPKTRVSLGYFVSYFSLLNNPTQQRKQRRKSYETATAPAPTRTNSKLRL